MGCNHEKLRCTDNHFFCLICGQEVQKKPKQTEEEKPVKKTTRKGK